LLLLGPTALAGRVPGTLAARPLTHGPGSKVVGGDGFDFASLKASANFAAISYCHNITAIAGWTCDACHGYGLEGFSTAVVIEDDKWDLMGYVGFSPDLDKIVVSFRGTHAKSLENWVSDLKFSHTDMDIPSQDGMDPSLDVRVHRGFFEAYHDSELEPLVRDAVQELMHDHKKWYSKPPGVLVLGHSLGAALAQIAALDLRYNVSVPAVSVHTFGSPRVGNKDFAKLLYGMAEEVLRVTHNQDMVPSLPPHFAGFHHSAQELYTLTSPAFPEMIVARLCDGSGEDPTCYDGACGIDGYGICTSLTDHLVYLGVQMGYTDSC